MDYQEKIKGHLIGIAKHEVKHSPELPKLWRNNGDKIKKGGDVMFYFIPYIPFIPSPTDALIMIGIIIVLIILVLIELYW